MSASEIIAPLVGLGLDYATVDWKNKKQLEQQKKLNKEQIAGSKEITSYNAELQKEMARYNQQLGLEMWEATNYAAQRKQMEKAGLNVGLMYGGVGAGGQTGNASGNVNTGSVSGGNAETPRTGMGIEAAMAMAQIENIKANTKKTEADTNKTTTVDTQEAQGRIAKLGAETKNEQLKSGLIQYETENKAIENQVMGRSLEDTLRAVKANANKLEGEAQKAGAEGTKAMEVINQNLKEQTIKMALLKAQIINTETDTKETNQKIAKIVQEMDLDQQQNKREWFDQQHDLLRIKMEAAKTLIQKIQTEFNTNQSQLEKLESETFKNKAGAFKQTTQ